MSNSLYNIYSTYLDKKCKSMDVSSLHTEKWSINVLINIQTNDMADNIMMPKAPENNLTVKFVFCTQSRVTTKN